MARAASGTQCAEIVVAYPPIEIWRAFTRADQLSYWLGDVAAIDLRVGGRYIVRGAFGLDLETMIDRVVEGRPLVLRPARGGDDAPIEIDLVKLAGAETKVSVTDPDLTRGPCWNEALENLRSTWERGVDLRESRIGVMGIGTASIAAGERPLPGVPEGVGVRLSAVLRGSPAEAAGIAQGDVLISFDGEPARSEESLIGRLRRTLPGTAVPVVVIRDGKPLTATVTLGRRQGRGEPPPSPEGLRERIRRDNEAAMAKLEEALAGLSDADAYREEAPGKWSVAQVLAHLSVVERTLVVWLDDALRSCCPQVTDEGVTSRVRLAAALVGRPPIQDLVARLARDQAETLELFRHVPSEAVAFKPCWARVALLALDYHTHVEDHLPQIARIRKAIGA